MNKRKHKKKKKKQDLFAASFVSSYKELKKFDRDYHEYIVSVKRIKYDEEWFNRVVDAWNDIPESYIIMR